MRARVVNGRLVIDEPTTLPDGTVLDLVVDDEGDDLTDEERARLDAAIERSARSATEGRARPASEVISELRNRE